MIYIVSTIVNVLNIELLLKRWYLVWSKIFVKVCCKGYSITLQEFKRNEGRVQGT